MAEKITHSLYNGKVKIDFYPNSHQYKKDGKNLISVTAITGMLDKSRVLIDWATRLDKAHILNFLETSKASTFTREALAPIIDEAFIQHTIFKERAASIGDQVHKFAEEFAKAKLGLGEMPGLKDDMPEEVQNGISAFLDWYNSNTVEFRFPERLTYSKKYGYVGTTDGYAIINGRQCVLDYKTSNGIYNEHRYQLSGYWQALEEEFKHDIEAGYILSFGKTDGALKVLPIERDEHLYNLDAFLGLLSVKKREKELQDAWRLNK